MTNINLIRSANINYIAKQGDSFAPPPVSFTIDGDAEVFSGATLKMEIRLFGQIVKTLTESDGISVNSNTLQFSISATDMADKAAGLYYYDLQKTISGIVTTIQHGTIELKPDVTK